MVVGGCYDAGASCTFLSQDAPDAGYRVTSTGFTPIVNSFVKHQGPPGVSGIWIAVGPPPLVTGIVSPNYVVLTVIYAPPGTDGGKSESSVVYGGGSTTGTTSSANNSFKQSYSVAVDSGAGLIGNGGGVGVSFTYGADAENGQSLDIKKSSTTTIKYPGPAADGIDHGRDAIYLWLNPNVRLSLNSSTAIWTFTGTETADIQYLYASWLANPSCSEDAKHPMCMPDNIRGKLKSYGIIESDFGAILAHDPLTNGSTTIDPKRFQALNTTFPYEPPISSTDPVLQTTFDVSNITTSVQTSTETDDYNVELTIHGEGSFLGLAKASAKTTGSWEWTNTTTSSSLNASSETASVTIGGPSYEYPPSGSTDMVVYYDTLYKTFAFVPYVGPPASFKGVLLDTNNRPMARAVVSISAHGVQYQTLTNSKGEWRIHGLLNGACQIGTGGQVKDVADCGTGQDLELKISEFRQKR